MTECETIQKIYTTTINEQLWQQQPRVYMVGYTKTSITH